MQADTLTWSFSAALGVVFIDLLLSGDNAIVIALACRSLDPVHRRRALWLGTLGAFLGRVLLTGVATLLMQVPLLKLVGGLLLLKIAIELIVNNHGPDHTEGLVASDRNDLFQAVKTIFIADVIMSLDNVLGLSAITQDNFAMLIAGLLLSVPILMFGSLYVARLLDWYPRLLWAGGGVLGAVGASLALGDPVFGDSFSASSTVAPLLVPPLAALYTVLQSRLILRNLAALGGRAPPPSLWQILRPTGLAVRTDVPTAEVQTLPPAVVPTPAPPALPQEAPAQLPQSTSSATSTVSTSSPVVAAPGVPAHARTVLLGVGAVAVAVVLVWLVRLLMTTSLMPTPEGFRVYECAKPRLTISYREGAQTIRMTSPISTISAPVAEQRIVWDDYRAAGQVLEVPPPTAIVSVDANSLVVDGGMFQNTVCTVAPK